MRVTHLVVSVWQEPHRGAQVSLGSWNRRTTASVSPRCGCVLLFVGLSMCVGWWWAGREGEAVLVSSREGPAKAARSGDGAAGGECACGPGPAPWKLGPRGRSGGWQTMRWGSHPGQGGVRSSLGQRKELPEPCRSIDFGQVPEQCSLGELSSPPLCHSVSVRERLILGAEGRRLGVRGRHLGEVGPPGLAKTSWRTWRAALHGSESPGPTSWESWGGGRGVGFRRD